MATSIQISRELHETLQALKERTRAKTFEELLRRLIDRPSRRSGRLGVHPEMKPFAHRDEAHEP